MYKSCSYEERERERERDTEREKDEGSLRCMTDKKKQLTSLRILALKKC